MVLVNSSLSPQMLITYKGQIHLHHNHNSFAIAMHLIFFIVFKLKIGKTFIRQIRQRSRIFTYMTSLYANYFEQKKPLDKKRVQLPHSWLRTPT